LSREPELTRRAIYRFYKDLGDDGPGCVLEWWCDRMATRGKTSNTDGIREQRERMHDIMRPYFFQVEEVVKPPRFINGNELMKTFGLSPSPVVGQILNQIEVAAGKRLTYRSVIFFVIIMVLALVSFELL